MEQSADEKAGQFVAAMRPYGQCAVTKANEIALLPDDPLYMAIAAKNACAAERLDAVAKINRIYSPDVRPTIIMNMDRRVEEAAVTRIINRRRSAA
jgi:hypothetical protein